MSRMLGTIRTDAPIDTKIENYIPKERNNSEAAKIMAKLELFKLMDRMNITADSLSYESESPDKDKKEIKQLLFRDNPDTAELYEKLKQKTVDFIAETDGENINTLDLCDGECIYSLNSFSEGLTEFIQKLFTDGSIRLRTHHSKPIFAILEKYDIDCSNIIFDTMLAAYLLNPNAPDYSPDRLMSEYEVTAWQCEKENALAGFVPLADTLTEEIAKKEQSELLNKIEIPLAKVLASMENAGFAVDKKSIQEYGKKLKENADRLKSSIYQRAGYEFNINSPKQLAAALFEKMGLPAKKKTKSGYSTNADVLEELKPYDPIIEEILEYRTLTKLKSTYCDGLVKVIGPDGRIHSNFNQTETRTGRISSTEPNLQNIPVRTELGREFRRFFIAKDGCMLVDADYSQIELRVLAHIANDQAMTEAFKNDLDIHTSTAAKVFNLPDEFVTPELRSRAKAVNFGIVYGIGAFSLSKDIGVTRKEADQYIKDYLSLYAGIDRYMKHTVEEAKEKGYAQTMFGRRRYLPELVSSNHNIRAFGERVARNMPIQGTSADIIKIAMIKVFNRLKKENMKSRLILQVHDELIIEAPENEAAQAAAILSEEMQNAVTLSLPLTADAGIGKTWYEAKN